ncbi:MAG: response regulator transcription factor [Lysobacteraceae bacterium]
MDQNPAKLRILLIEDQRSLAENLWEFLEVRGHVMDHAGDGVTGLQLALDNTYEVIVLDIGLPRINGIEVCRRYRAQGGTAPILMLTARDQLEDKLLGFESGADDYMTKPFAMRELEARIHVLHTRQQRQSPAILHVADLALDITARYATRQGQLLNISPAGYRLLEVLMRKSPHVLLYAELAQALWGDADHDPARLHTHVSLLRTAVDRPFDQPLILTVHGFGYRLVPPAAT